MRKPLRCWRQVRCCKKDMGKAVELWRKAVVLGHAEAQCSLGACYANGKGARKDADTAAELHRKY
jgi:TPR repeat protein